MFKFNFNKENDDDQDANEGANFKFNFNTEDAKEEVVEPEQEAVPECREHEVPSDPIPETTTYHKVFLNQDPEMEDVLLHVRLSEATVMEEAEAEHSDLARFVEQAVTAGTAYSA